MFSGGGWLPLHLSALRAPHYSTEGVVELGINDRPFLPFFSLSPCQCSFLFLSLGWCPLCEGTLNLQWDVHLRAAGKWQSWRGNLATGTPSRELIRVLASRSVDLCRWRVAPSFRVAPLWKLLAWRQRVLDFSIVTASESNTCETFELNGCEQLIKAKAISKAQIWNACCVIFIHLVFIQIINRQQFKLLIN